MVAPQASRPCAVSRETILAPSLLGPPRTTPTRTLLGVQTCHHDDGRRYRKQVGATPFNHRERTTRTGHGAAIACHFLVGTFSLEGDEPAALPKQGGAPRPQTSKRRDRSRDDNIGTRELLLDSRLFRTA